MASPQDEERQALAAQNGAPLSTKARLVQRAETSFGKVPALRQVPLPAIGIIALLVLVNIFVWCGIAIVLVST